MKRVYVNEEWCLGCHLCEYYCAFQNSGESDMVKAFGRDEKPVSRIRVEDVDGEDGIHFAVSCRHCDDPQCVKGCITGALSIKDGVISVNEDKCIGCCTCVLSCPYGAIVIDEGKAIKKCDLCVKNGNGEPACVANCPNRAIVFEERG